MELGALVLSERPRHITELHTGSVLGESELLLQLPSASDVETWIARKARTRGPTGLHLLRIGLVGDSREVRESFDEELRILSRIRHRSLQRFLGAGSAGDVGYVAFEWQIAEPLTAWIEAARRERRAIPIPIVCAIGIDVALALHAVHEARVTERPLAIVHRDVSPAAITVAVDGAVKIGDFGLARALGGPRDATEAGVGKGRIRYLAPEQLTSTKVDRRADVRALSLTLYALLSVDEPYARLDPARIAKSIVHGEPPGRTHHIPDALRRVLERAWARDPQSRYATALDLAFALEVVIGKHRASDADIAAFTRVLFGDLRERRSRQVDVACAQLDRRSSRPPPPPRRPTPLAFTAPSVDLAVSLELPYEATEPGVAVASSRPPPPSHTPAPPSPRARRHAPTTIVRTGATPRRARAWVYAAVLAVPMVMALWLASRERAMRSESAVTAASSEAPTLGAAAPAEGTARPSECGDGGDEGVATPCSGARDAGASTAAPP